MIQKPGAVELTRLLVRTNTVNPPGREGSCAHLLAQMLEPAGYVVRLHEFSPGRTSLVATIGAGDRPRLAFTGHLDTVPIGTAPWAHDPFGAEISGGKLWGRGSSDMKSGIAAFIDVAIRLAPQLMHSPGVALIITAGEETGCEGARHLVAESLLPESIGALLVGEPTGSYPILGHKGALWLHACTHGIAAHGSMPSQGDNAIYKAARAVTRLESYQTSEIHDFFGRSTINVGTISGGLNINSVPDSATIGVDIRTVPGEDHRALMADIQRTLGEQVELRPVLDLAPLYTEPGHPWVRDVHDIMSDILQTPVEARGISYFTDASVLHQPLGGPPTIVLGPGEPQLAHQTDEYCYVSSIEKITSAYERIVARWCFG